MRKSELSFFGTDVFEKQAAVPKENKTKFMCFDWDKAASYIKLAFERWPNCVIEAGLQNDWGYTAGIIFENGKPTIDNYTYLSSNWATPTLVVLVDGEEIEEIPCFTFEHESRFESDSKWDETSLSILGINI